MKLHWSCWAAIGAGISYAGYRLLAATDDSADALEDESLPLSLTRTISFGIDAVTGIFTGNKRLTNAKINSAGVVKDSPEDLTAVASEALGRTVSVEVYTLARAIASEGGNESEFSKKLRAHVILNQAKQRGMTITALALFHTAPARNGHYGRQIGGAFATSKDPFTTDVDVAETAQLERSEGGDPTGGAIQFSDRDSFGIQEGTTSWPEHLAERSAEGKVGAVIPGSRNGLVFWYKGFVPSFTERVV